MMNNPNPYMLLLALPTRKSDIARNRVRIAQLPAATKDGMYVRNGKNGALVSRGCSSPHVVVPVEEAIAETTPEQWAKMVGSAG